MAAGFVLVADPGNTEYRVFTIASQAYTIGDAVDVSRTAATVIPSTSASVNNATRGVAMQTVTASATTLLVCLATDRQRWTADTTNTANAAHNYQRMVFGASARIINNTGTDSTTSSGIFEQLGLAPLMGANRIVGRFLTTTNITA